MVEKYYRPRPKVEGQPNSHKLAERLYHSRRNQNPPLSPEKAAENVTQAGYPTTGEDWRAVESTDAFPTSGRDFAKAVEKSGLGENQDIQKRMSYDVLHDRFGERADELLKPPEDLSQKQ